MEHSLPTDSPSLLTLVQDTAEPWATRLRAAVALGHLGAEAARVIPLLTEWVQGDDATLCATAAIALGHMGARAADAVPR